MIRRQSLETKINHERWLISYADFITLLFAFFVVMYSVSQVNENKYKTLSETLQTAFSSPSRATSNAEIQTHQGGQNSSPSLAQLPEIQQQLESALAGMLDDGQVNINGNEHWVDVTINANAIFTSGKAELSVQAKRAFRDIADIIAPSTNAVAVAGHTDNIPISNADFENNWALSSARAVSVVNLLSYSGVSPERLSAVGYGEYRPAADNNTADGRNKNRRVVLRIAKEKVALPPIAISQVGSNASDNTDAKTLNQSENLAKSAISSRDNLEKTLDNNTEIQNVVAPKRLKSGGLLFTNDPEAARNNR